jgi:hypothetical protein
MKDKLRYLSAERRINVPPKLILNTEYMVFSEKRYYREALEKLI